jgi:hypothetical protein
MTSEMTNQSAIASESERKKFISSWRRGPGVSVSRSSAISRLSATAMAARLSPALE